MNPLSAAASPALARAVEPDEQALARAVSRDPAAFAQLYRRYLTPVYSYSLARVGNSEEARDLTSQTFLAALEGLDRYRGQSKFSTWLFGIARNKCAEYLRRQSGRGHDLPMDGAVEVPASDPQPQELVERRARFEELARKAKQLPADQAEALSLRIFGGLSAAETGQVMGKSEPAVKMLVHRAVCDLRARLADWREAES